MDVVNEARRVGVYDEGKCERYRAALEENYPLLLDGTWYDDHDAAQERLGRIREALADERISRTLDD